MQMRRFLVILLFFVIFQTRAQAYDIALLGGVNYAAPTERQAGSNRTWTGNAGLAYGASIGIPLFDSPFDFETGVFWLTSDTSANLSGVATNRSFTMTEVPLLARFHFDQWISLGFGGYFSFAEGTVDTQTSTLTRQGYGDAGLASSDAGLLISLRAKLYFAESFAFVIDARYQHGLKNMAASSADLFNTRSIQALGGVSFMF